MDAAVGVAFLCDNRPSRCCAIIRNPCLIVPMCCRAKPLLLSKRHDRPASQAGPSLRRCHVDGIGVAATPVEGLVILRETAPTMLQYAVSKPLVALVHVAQNGRH